MIPKLESCVQALRNGVHARAHPRRPHPARAPARVLHPRGHRHDGGPMSDVNALDLDAACKLDAEHVMQTYGRHPGRVRARRGHAALGQRGQRVPRLPRRARGHVARSRASRGRRLRSPTRRARCCTCRTCTSTRCSPSSAERLDLLLTSATGTPGRVFFANSGAEANECAIKLARRYGQTNGGPGPVPRALRVQLVPRPHAHHARGDRAAAEAGDVPAAAGGLPPGRVRRPRRAGAAMDERVCAVLLEAVQGEGGVQPAPPGLPRGGRAGSATSVRRC